MVKGYNKAHRELDDRRIPAPCLVESIRAQIRDGHLKAEKLTEVATADQVDEDDIHSAHSKSDGSPKIARGATASVPIGPTMVGS